MHSGKTTTTQSSKLQRAPPPSPLACCCTGGQGGCKLSPQLALSSGNRKSRGPLCKDHRDGSVQDLLQQQPFSWWFSTAAYHTTDAATSPPIRLTEGVLFFLKKPGGSKDKKGSSLMALFIPADNNTFSRTAYNWFITSQWFTKSMITQRDIT